MVDRLRKFVAQDWIIFVAIGAATVLSLLAYPHLPDRVPIHWNWRGVPDGFAPKDVAAFLMPGASVLIYFLIAVMLSIDPKWRGDSAGRAFQAMRLAAPGFMLAMHVVMVASWLSSRPVHVMSLVFVGMGIMFAVLGRYMPQLEPNYTAGIRVPWTLEDPVVWKKTHEMAGPIFVIGGLSIMLAGLFPPLVQVLYVVTVSIVISIIPCVYAYRLYKQRH